MTHCKATIKSLPIDVLILIIEILRFDVALELCDALQVPEQVAAQYCYLDKKYYNINLKPNSYKFLLKNKRFQIEASSYEKTEAAVRTFDLEFIENYMEEVKPDLNFALSVAAGIGFTDAVKFLLSDTRVDPSALDNEALKYAAWSGHVEIVKLLLSDSRVDPSAGDNGALEDAARNGHTETVKLLLSDSRLDSSAEKIEYMSFASGKEVKKLLKSYLKKKKSKE